MTTRPYGADHTNVGQPPRKRDSISPQCLTILMMKRSGASPRGVSQLGTDTRESYAARTLEERVPTQWGTPLAWRGPRAPSSSSTKGSTRALAVPVEPEPCEESGGAVTTRVPHPPQSSSAFVGFGSIRPIGFDD